MSESDRLDIAAIMRQLPHRYPFLLVDRVLECVAGQHCLALKNVTVNEPFFQGHFPHRPVMPRSSLRPRRRSHMPMWPMPSRPA